MGQAMITATHASALPLEAAQVRGGGTWTRSVTTSAELARFGPQAGMAELLERWPAAVGEAIARNAWPARIANDGTVHVNTADSVWAFELGQRPGRSRERARRSAAPVRARAAPARPTKSLPEPPLEPTPEEEQRARAAGHRDRRRKAARKCAKSGQIEPREGRAATARSDTL